MATNGNGNGTGTVPPIPPGPAPLPPFWWVPNLPPELAPLLGVIASGVTEVRYADRTIRYASIGDLLKAWSIMQGLLGTGGPRRRFACFAKGFDSPIGGLEHQEIRDVLWSREVVTRRREGQDVDWERAA